MFTSNVNSAHKMPQFCTFVIHWFSQWGRTFHLDSYKGIEQSIVIILLKIEIYKNFFLIHSTISYNWLISFTTTKHFIKRYQKLKGKIFCVARIIGVSYWMQCLDNVFGINHIVKTCYCYDVKMFFLCEFIFFLRMTIE